MWDTHGVGVVENLVLVVAVDNFSGSALQPRCRGLYDGREERLRDRFRQCQAEKYSSWLPHTSKVVKTKTRKEKFMSHLDIKISPTQHTPDSESVILSIRAPSPGIFSVDGIDCQDFCSSLGT